MMARRLAERQAPLLHQLPAELQLRIAELAPDNHRDRAALCLAIPTLGLAALRVLPAYRHILVSVGLRLFSAGAALFDDSLLRRYAARADATAEGASWLSAAAANAGSALGLRRQSPEGDGAMRWLLVQGGRDGAVLKESWPGGVVRHYEGERGAERIVRVDWPDGDVEHYEGEKGAEQLVRYYGA